MRVTSQVAEERRHFIGQFSDGSDREEIVEQVVVVHLDSGQRFEFDHEPDDSEIMARLSRGELESAMIRGAVEAQALAWLAEQMAAAAPEGMMMAKPLGEAVKDGAPTVADLAAFALERAQTVAVAWQAAG